MKRLMLVCGLVALFAVPAASASTVSGSATTSSPFVYTFSSTTPATVAATYAPKANRGYTLILTSDTGFLCRADASYPGWSHPTLTPSASISCTDDSGVGGNYTATFYPTKGSSVSVTLTIS